MNTLQGNPSVETREIRKKKVLGDEFNVGAPLFKGTRLWNEIKEKAFTQ